MVHGRVTGVTAAGVGQESWIDRVKIVVYASYINITSLVSPNATFVLLLPVSPVISVIEASAGGFMYSDALRLELNIDWPF